mmetsp:Transcript_35445/g.78638  ORF Transcript_35445/g.78638 Transcript_35445/m.78638 type:complete len:331 (-) Transcript_35445:737-1729(-)
MAKAVHVTKFDAEKYLDYVTLVEIPIPEPGSGEVLVQPYMRPVNPTDVAFIKGAYGPNFPLPRVPGSEGVARVIKNGPGSSKFQEGQRVVAAQWPQFTNGGTWTTHTVVPQNILFPVPDEVSDETAAQFFINPVTVYGMFHELNVPAGEWLLQTAASSVLGRQVLQLAQHRGIKTINIVRRKEAVQELLDLGADAVISTDTEDIVERVQQITGGKGAYAAIDAIGGPQTSKVVGALRKWGTYMVYGLLDLRPMELSVSDLLVQQKVVRGFLIYEWIEQQDKASVVAAVMKLLADKVIVPFSGESFPMEQVKEVLVKSQEVGRGAKLFLRN